MQSFLSRSKILPVGSRRRKETKRFVKFSVVGALGAITDFAILFLLVELAGLQPVVANGFGFSAAVIQNFLLNRWWTFPESRIQNSRRQMLKFALVSAIGLGLSTIVFLSIHHYLEAFWTVLLSNPDIGYRVSYNFAKLLSIGVVLFWNFTANRLWTFSKGL